MLHVINITFSIENINSKKHYLDQEISSLLSPPFGPDLAETKGGTASFWDPNPQNFRLRRSKIPSKIPINTVKIKKKSRLRRVPLPVRLSFPRVNDRTKTWSQLQNVNWGQVLVRGIENFDRKAFVVNHRT